MIDELHLNSTGPIHSLSFNNIEGDHKNHTDYNNNNKVVS